MKLIKEHDPKIFEEKVNDAIENGYVIVESVHFSPAVTTNEAMVEESFFWVEMYYIIHA